MRLLTLNTHSIIENEYLKKCDLFVNSLLKLQPDIIALQEVNQSILSAYADKRIYLKEDNHILRIVNKLKENNVDYNFNWLKIKNGYGRFDEGISFLSKFPIDDTYSITLSSNDDCNNWKTRKSLIIKINDTYFCNTHMGWWNDSEEPFKNQFDKLDKFLSKHRRVFILGDFNAPSDVRNEGYDYVCSKGWKDTYHLALEKDSGCTVKGKISGWENTDKEYQRIDYIFCSRSENVLKSQVVFNGINEAVVSDHYGVMIDIE